METQYILCTPDMGCLLQLSQDRKLCLVCNSNNPETEMLDGKLTTALKMHPNIKDP
jgi:hypothetical protein